MNKAQYYLILILLVLVNIVFSNVITMIGSLGVIYLYVRKKENDLLLDKKVVGILIGGYIIFSIIITLFAGWFEYRELYPQVVKLFREYYRITPNLFPIILIGLSLKEKDSQ